LVGHGSLEKFGFEIETDVIKQFTFALSMVVMKVPVVEL